MNKILLLVLVSVCFSMQGLSAQEFNVPVKYKFETVDGYKKYEPEVLKCIDWLMANPYNKNRDKRTEASTFLFYWVTGCPYVDVVLDSDARSISAETPHLLMIYMGGWAKEALKAADDLNETDLRIRGKIAGLNAVIEFYHKNELYLTKSKAIEKYSKMHKRGTLNAYVAKSIL